MNEHEVYLEKCWVTTGIGNIFRQTKYGETKEYNFWWNGICMDMLKYCLKSHMLSAHEDEQERINGTRTVSSSDEWTADPMFAELLI